MTDERSSLNPTQRRTLELLRRPAEPPEPVGDVVDGLVALLEDGLGPLVDVIETPNRLVLHKHALAGLNACEASWMAERASFAWSTRTARGTVVHKAIELAVHWHGEPIPGELVEHAVERLAASDRSIASYLGALDPAERAELVAACVDLVSKFQECVPPLRAAFRPVSESRVEAKFLDGRVVLTGVVDLTLGRPDGDRPGKVILDYKTGQVHAAHREDLRFYALLEAVRLGVPPRLVATLELDSGTVHHETVTPALLEAAARRVVDTARRLAALDHLGAEPVRRPGPRCRWCPIASGCEPGKAWLAGDDR